MLVFPEESTERVRRTVAQRPLTFPLDVQQSPYCRTLQQGRAEGKYFLTPSSGVFAFPLRLDVEMVQFGPRPRPLQFEQLPGRTHGAVTCDKQIVATDTHATDTHATDTHATDTHATDTHVSCDRPCHVQGQ
jgi:hypothetical protein